MEPAFEALLAQYERRGAEEMQLMRTLSHHELSARIDEFLLSVGPETGRLLHTLATGAKAKTIVELGVSYGYSTLWLAHAARITGGRLHSFELSASKVAYTREQLQKVDLDSFVEFHIGSALDNLPKLAGPYDLVLIDLWKDLYAPCFELVHPKLAPDALVIADNIVFPGGDFAPAYQQQVRSKGDMDSLLLNVGSGIEVSRKRRV
jgi:predicted O-methyltransferase YrrM